ncbi:unnamed protein product [Ectocarpus sp. 12 AP-2014]
MRTCRGLLLVFLAGPYLACLADEGASIPPAAATAAAADAAEDEVFSKLAEAEQAANAAAAAAQRAAASLEDMENRAQEEEGQEENEGSEERVDSNDDHVDGGGAAAEDDKAALEAADAAAAAAADAAAAEAADAAAAAAAAVAAATAEGISDEDDDLVDSAAAAVERALGDEDGGGGGGFDAEKWKREAGRQWGRVTGRVDGFIDGWRRDGDGNPYKGALGSYDALLEEHYLKMSFGQATALGVVGDTVAQRLERWRNPGQRYEFLRTVHAGILNMIIDGIFTPHWYNLVDYINDEMTLGLAFVKAVASSVFYGPFANGLFLAGARVLRYGLKTRFGWAEWRRQLTVCTIRDFEMWPPLHVLNFWLVPKHWRPLAGHLAGVVLLAVISCTGLTDAGLPLGQRAVPLMMRWARAVGGRLSGKGRRASGAPPAK